MRTLLISAVLVLAPLHADATKVGVAAWTEVVRIVDGQTIVVRHHPPSFRGQEDGALLVTVRILGIDCPANRESTCGRWRKGLACVEEIKLGRRAAARVKELLPSRSTFEMSLRFEILRRPKAYVEVVELNDGTNLGELLVSEGLCRRRKGESTRWREDQLQDPRITD